MSSAPHDPIDASLATHRPVLFGLCYRMTGDVATAEDLVQETFVRALTHPPADRDRSWAPWLVRVATNLAIDALRRRRRQPYTGPWLPGLVETPPGAPLEPVAPASDPELRLAAAQSLSYGFMLALEVLTPMQRATLLLRDAFGYSGPETAQMLGVSDENVRITLHRARKRLQGAEPEALDRARARAEHSVGLLAELAAAAGAGDEAGLLARMAEGVELRSDGGGRYAAALKPITGRDRVTKFILGVGPKHQVLDVALRWLNCEPMLLMSSTPLAARVAPRTAMRAVFDEAGRASAIHLVLAPGKLHGVDFGSSTPSVSR
jgi:RNA polymerase sigma-70 factor (ECF subfamily)